MPQALLRTLQARAGALGPENKKNSPDWWDTDAQLTTSQFEAAYRIYIYDSI
jgi:hypothetical protein